MTWKSAEKFGIGDEVEGSLDSSAHRCPSGWLIRSRIQDSAASGAGASARSHGWISRRLALLGGLKG